MKAVHRMLGRASAAMTLGTYADLFDEDLDVVATRLNDQMPLVALPSDFIRRLTPAKSSISGGWRLISLHPRQFLRTGTASQ